MSLTSLADKKSLSRLRRKLHEIIFEADTTAGKTFDLLLIVCILMSVAVVMLDSVKSIRMQYAGMLDIVEWTLTGIFTVEYVLRLYCIGKPKQYAFSFYGLIDLFAILPTYVGFFLPGAQYLVAVRVLRVSRVFRVLKFSLYLGEADLLVRSLVASRRRILVFLSGVVSIVVLLGTVMYVVEGGLDAEKAAVSGFTSIPRSVYWAIVTMTTVGYGDIRPITALGQIIASTIMIMGYSIIAIPTGIVTAEMVSTKRDVSTQSCPDCAAEGHAVDADFCRKCGTKLNP